MGQRHQFYVIANVGGRYRLLAAAHHQWMYGDGAVAQCLRLLRILSAAGNLSGIRRDLRRALDVDWSNDIWVDKSKKQAADSLFPFIATCLAIGSSVGSSSFQTMLLNVNTHFYDLPNDDGISVYDITEPQHPRYCFMFPGENVLLDALQYMYRYHRRSDKSAWPATYDRKAMSPPDVQGCLDHRPVTVEAMYDTWSQKKVKFSSLMLDVSAYSAEHNTSVPQHGKATLKDQSLARLLDTAFESTDLNWMTEAELLPEFRLALKTKVYDDPEKLPLTPLGLQLLARAIAGDSSIDLSRFPLSFPDTQVVLHQACGGKSSVFRSLFMPEIRSLTAVDLKSIVDDYTPSRLVLGTTPRIPLEQQLQTIHGTSISDFISHAMYKRSLERTSRFARKLPTLSPEKYLDQQSQPQIAQVIFLKHFPTSEAPITRLSGGGIKWSELSPTSNVWSFREKEKPATLLLPLRDAPISPTRMALLLPVLKSLSNIKEQDCDSFSVGSFIKDIAKTYASANDMVRPLPAELMVEYDRYSTSSIEHPLKALKLGSVHWTLLATCVVSNDTKDTHAVPQPAKNVDSVAGAADMVSGDSKASNDMLAEIARLGIAPKQQLRYSFVRRGEDGEVCIMNASEFLHCSLADFEDRLAAAESAWQKAAKEFVEDNLELLGLGSCATEEVREALAYLEARDARIDAYIEANKEELDSHRKSRQLAGESW